ncbi:hypothetical protein NDU88_008420 [Pleurodeles waltl]|uniref:Uncharacterized protein n=1 Tax=Pleurodeles waltl TaxID=8319 RepID=A0AAV7NW06_PLEWA|nr:hypothetical protein NDU88_008420 [Pleurodeles waltl]
MPRTCNRDTLSSPHTALVHRSRPACTHTSTSEVSTAIHVQPKCFINRARATICNELAGTVRMKDGYWSLSLSVASEEP